MKKNNLLIIYQLGFIPILLWFSPIFLNLDFGLDLKQKAAITGFLTVYTFFVMIPIWVILVKTLIRKNCRNQQ